MRRMEKMNQNPKMKSAVIAFLTELGTGNDILVHRIIIN